jgi:hypothetical protein
MSISGGFTAENCKKSGSIIRLESERRNMQCYLRESKIPLPVLVFSIPSEIISRLQTDFSQFNPLIGPPHSVTVFSHRV